MFIGAYVARRYYRAELDKYKTTLIQAQLKAAAYKTAAKRKDKLHTGINGEDISNWSPDEPQLP